MRRSVLGILVLIMTVVLAIPASLATVAAQGATPQAESSDTTAYGEPVSYISESGSEIATLTVTRALRGWDEFEEFYEPEVGTEYVAFEIEVTHLGRRGDLLVRAFDFRLQDVDGFLLSQAFVSASSDAELLPTEDDLAIASDETDKVVVVFQVIEGIELSNIYWLPDYDRMITLADLADL